jgi:hypothetical protein
LASTHGTLFRFITINDVRAPQDLNSLAQTIWLTLPGMTAILTSIIATFHVFMNAARRAIIGNDVVLSHGRR